MAKFSGTTHRLYYGNGSGCSGIFRIGILHGFVHHIQEIRLKWAVRHVCAS